jgi:5'-methylthioadenosine phosphorylase
MAQARVAVIGGSAFYEMEGLTEPEEVRRSTPFGDPSDSIVLGTLEGVRMAFLPRHGRGHRILPGEMPARANIYALKSLGVEFIISISAVGSLREDLKPLHLVVLDQLIDRTKARPSTFFGDGLVAHIAMADPFCPVLSEIVYDSARDVGATVHRGGACVVMEGPAFSTRAESHLYRSWGADLIGMTALPEAKLAREAEICYVTLASVTDYDTWYKAHAEVTAEMIVDNLSRNAATCRRVVASALRRLPDARRCLCASALDNALVTPFHLVPDRTKDALEPIIGRFLKDAGGGSR